MFLLYWCLKTLCPDACPMVRNENEHNEKRETMVETLSDMRTHTHKAITTETHMTHSASLCLATTLNKALILYMHSQNSVFAFTNKYFNVEKLLTSTVSTLLVMEYFLIKVFLLLLL